MKKLILNKETIAQLTNPDRIFGGEGAGGPITQTCATCVTCYDETCEGSCNNATCAGQKSCLPPLGQACAIDHY